MGRNSDKALKRRVRRSYVVSTVSIALVLFLMGTVGYLMSSVLRTAATMRESVTMIVELRDGLTEAQRDSIGATLAANKMTADVKFVSKDDKLADEEFRNRDHYFEAVNGWLGGTNNMTTNVWWADHTNKRK